MINQAAVTVITLPAKIRKNRRMENLINNFIRAIGCGKPKTSDRADAVLTWTHSRAESARRRESA